MNTLAFLLGSPLTATSVPHVLWLSLRLLLLISLFLLGAIEWKRIRKTSKTTSPDTTASSKSSETSTGWILRSLINRRARVRVSDEERRDRRIFVRLKGIIPQKPKGLARLRGIFSLLLLVGFAAGGYIRPFWYPVETRRDVYVWNETRGLDNSWGIWTAEHGWERFDCCPDFPCNTGVVKVGWIADEVRYQERGYCKSVRAEGLGFWWHKNGRTRRIQ